MWDINKGAGLELPNELTDALKAVTEVTYPNISTVLNVLLVTPVTTATLERSNSALAYVKTDLRSTMKEIRLNDLQMLFVHKDIPLNYGAVIDLFALKHPRKMMFVDPLHITFDHIKGCRHIVADT